MNLRIRHLTVMRRVATIAAIVLLLGQAIAGAHFHPAAAQREFSAGSAASIAESSCAICAAQLHSPAASAVAPALNAPTVLERVVVRSVDAGSLSKFVQSRFGRAPPASV